ncbi:MAG: putative molybdenum carrier protein [Proteobacteria bacterium]|nr:putative molybdenum carrier protein [Pseudomonadota bacterium]
MKSLKVISGGQTGVDRAAIDTAISCGLPYGGAIPKGRLAEDGVIDIKYDCLYEIDSPDYEVRTKKNVEDADATLIFNLGVLEGGTALTLNFAKILKKPYLVVNLDDEGNPVLKIVDWINKIKPSVLNIAGPRESKCPGIYEKTCKILVEVFKIMDCD